MEQAGAPPPAAFDAQADPCGDEPQLRAALTACHAELRRAHSMLAHRDARCRQLEQAVHDLRHALAGATRELASTRASERDALDRALHDPLTRLPNAAHFLARLRSALQQTETTRRPVTVLFIDLDGFKRVNDIHGHETGDAVLRVVASRLLSGVRLQDLVGRLGGDEFACLLIGVPDREQMSRLACELLNAVSSPLQIGPLKLVVRPSIGVAMAPHDGHTPRMLMKRADAAMYRAKRHRCGYAFHEQGAAPHDSNDADDADETTDATRDAGDAAAPRSAPLPSCGVDDPSAASAAARR